VPLRQTGKKRIGRKRKGAINLELKEESTGGSSASLGRKNSAGKLREKGRLIITQQRKRRCCNNN